MAFFHLSSVQGVSSILAGCATVTPPTALDLPVSWWLNQLHHYNKSSAKPDDAEVPIQFRLGIKKYLEFLIAPIVRSET